MLARTAKLAKKMEAVIKPYIFEDSDPVAILSFLGQSEKVCTSNEESKVVAMWILLLSKTKSPAASHKICLTPRKDLRDKMNRRHGEEGQGSIYA